MHTKAICFLGTPHRGSSFTRLGYLAALFLRPLGSNPSLITEVEYDSESLLNLQEKFENTLPDDLRVVNFYEQRPTRILSFWFLSWEEFVSSIFSAGLRTLTTYSVCQKAVGNLRRSQRYKYSSWRRPLWTEQV
jgi:hypothetical protein